ncbi:MAG TPA: VOC family protein [Gemmatimonadales bacterium]|nr:VOC family protein [Gemmatimonadales bacterium]
MLKQLTPVLIVEEIEPCLGFWTGGLGLEQVHQIPGPNGKLMFASVKQGAIEVMYQSRASVLADDPAMAAELAGRSIVLFIEVDDLDAVEKAVAGASVVKPRHTTFYGSEEIYVREPGGHTVGFAQMQAA